MTFRILAFVLGFVFYVSLNAQSGAIDQSFGKDGYVEGQQLDGRSITSLANLKDSSIMAVGTLYTSGRNYGTVSKYSKDGISVKGFGVSGVRNYSLVSNGLTRFDRAVELRDGCIVICGTTYSYSLNSYATFLLKIDTETGEPDTTFGGTGKVMFENYTILQVDFLKEDSSSNILYSFGISGMGSRVYKFDKRGRLDSAFMVTKFDRINKASMTWNSDLMVTADNHYLLCYKYPASTMYVELFDTSGVNVKSAPINSKINYGLSNPYYIKTYRLVPDSDTSFLACVTYIRTIDANTSKYLNGIQIFRYDLKGNVIKSFGRNGAVTRDMYTGKCYGINLLKRDNAGRFIIGFNVEDTVFEDGTATPLAFYDAIVCRLKPDGTYDSTFNGNGIFRGFKNKEVGDQLTDIMISSDNRMLVAGYILWNATDASQFLCRFKEGKPFHHSGFTQEQLQGVKVFPVPFSGQVSVNGVGGDFRFTLYDARGRAVREGIAEQRNICSLGDLMPGVYFLKIISEKNKSFLLKVVKE